MTVEESSPSETQNCFFDGYSNWVQTFLEEISNNQTNGGQTSSNWIPDESTSNSNQFQAIDRNSTIN